MKKMMIALAVALTAVFANASSFMWKLTPGAEYAGMSVYALTGTTATDVLSLCASATASDWDTAFSGSAPVSVTGSGTRAAASGTTDGIAGNDNLVFVILDGEVAEGTQYWVASDYKIPAGNVFDPPASGTRVNLTLAGLGTAGSGTFASVPEPTSGLLLLLGMAGLALRRKQK